MPRLSDDQIKAGIVHPDPDVRMAAVRYFSDRQSPDASVMPVAIEALERYGRAGAFRYAHVLVGLAQSEASVRWAFEELDAPGRDISYLGVITRLLCDADPRLIAPYENKALARHGFFPAERDRMLRRVDNLSRGSEELWRELEAICEEGKDREYAGRLRWDEAEDAVTALALRGPASHDRMMATLAEQITEVAGNPAIWMQSLMVRLAGEIRHGPAVPLLVRLLHEDGEVLNEECVRALGRIGTDEVVRAIREQYSSANDHFRTYAIGALEKSHTDLCVTTCAELLKLEDDPDLRGFLASALVGHFSTEGNEVAREALLADPGQASLRDELLVACALTGQDFPELPVWRCEAEEEARAREKRAREWMVPAPSSVQGTAMTRAQPARTPAAVKTGRNDPCPCGSGKKFKKCCLARDEGA